MSDYKLPDSVITFFYNGLFDYFKDKLVTAVSQDTLLLLHANFSMYHRWLWSKFVWQRVWEMGRPFCAAASSR